MIYELESQHAPLDICELRGDRAIYEVKGPCLITGFSIGYSSFDGTVDRVVTATLARTDGLPFCRIAANRRNCLGEASDLGEGKWYAPPDGEMVVREGEKAFFLVSDPEALLVYHFRKGVEANAPALI